MNRIQRVFFLEFGARIILVSSIIKKDQFLRVGIYEGVSGIRYLSYSLGGTYKHKKKQCYN